MSHVLSSGKGLQEKLSYYLDLIEMQIAHQISHKSDAFFQAVASHDTVREELGKALTAVKALRLQVTHVDSTQVQGSLKGVVISSRLSNCLFVIDCILGSTSSTVPDWPAKLRCRSSKAEIDVDGSSNAADHSAPAIDLGFCWSAGPDQHDAGSSPTGTDEHPLLSVPELAAERDGKLDREDALDGIRTPHDC